MQNRPSENLKPVAAELASLLHAGSGEAEKMDFLFQQLARQAAPGEVPVAAPPDRADDSVGIWRPSADGCYERDADRRLDWPLWANVHRIDPKGKKKRVLLLGESVARGYFYDPFYTVAQELEAILTHTPELKQSEVIDLARTSMDMSSLLALARASIRLEPDAVVVFAGNNWLPALRDTLDAAAYETIFSRYIAGGFSLVKSFLEERFSKLVTGFLEQLAAPFREKAIPVVFVIPPFNLKDWQSDDMERILPWVPGDTIYTWLDARRQAEEAFVKKDTDIGIAAAMRMVESDPSNPLGFELLGRGYLQKQKMAEAIWCFEEARDTVLVSRGNNSKPRCLGVIAHTIESDGARLGLRIVNLPMIFNAAARGVPGRELFLDYCHLTVKGIKEAMLYTARELLRALGYNGDACTQNDELRPAADVLAMAHFCAAIHNAHYGQPAELIDFHCREAVRLSGGIKDIMARYADFSNRRLSTALCKAFGDILADGSMRQYEGGLALQHPKAAKLLDMKLNDGIARALVAEDPDLQAHIDKLRKSEHAVGEEPTDLLESFYSKTSYNDFVVQPAPNFYQARSVVSSFCFVADRYTALAFQLAFRTPGRQYPDKAIVIFINGRQVASLPMSSRWMTCSFPAGEANIKSGCNQLEIHWPYTAEPVALVRSYGPGVLDALFPVLGEVYSFTVSVIQLHTPAVAVQDSSLSLHGA